MKYLKLRYNCLHKLLQIKLLYRYFYFAFFIIQRLLQLVEVPDCEGSTVAEKLHAVLSVNVSKNHYFHRR
jgi:hypothetical protein